MPALDKTGPAGQGAQTGRKMGRCNPDAETETGRFFSRRRFAARTVKDNSRNETGGGSGFGKGFGRIFGRNRGRQV
jgi:hypothetical protein